MSMKNRYIYTFAFIFVCALRLFAVEKDSLRGLFDLPMDHQQILSGTFAELRPAHFHAGVDFKTQGVVGKKIYSPASGYISRISVAHGGYGKAVYITHDNGYTTVYGHLDQFAPRVDSLIRTVQYKNEDYRATLDLPRDSVRVERGELIAYSGNTGGSGGPHLHYEIRRTQDNVPLNPLLFGNEVKDNQAPYIGGIYFINLDGQDTINRINSPRAIHFGTAQYHPTVKASGKVGILVRAHDTADGAYNHNGFYSMRMYVNGKKAYGVTLDHFPMEHTKQIELHTLYDYYAIRRVHLTKCYVEPHNELTIYDEDIEREAVLDMSNDTRYDIRIEVGDVHGNVASREFTLVGDDSATKTSVRATATNDGGDAVLLFRSGKENKIIYRTFQADFPRGIFYKDTQVGFCAVDSMTYRISCTGVPLTGAFTVSFDVSDVDSTMRSKTFVARPWKDKKGQIHYSMMGGYVKGDRLYLSTTSFGEFTVACDTVPPVITRGNWQEGSRLKTQRMTMYIRDTGIGLDTYKAYVDGRWVLMEYEYKQRRLTLHTDREGITAGRHTLRLVVRDAAGNESVYEGVFVK